MKYIIVFSFLFFVTISFYHCKKENEIIVKDTLFFTLAEANIIFSADSTQPFSFLNALDSSHLQTLKKPSRNIKISNDTTTYLYKRLLKTIKLNQLTSIAAPEIGINRNIIIVKRNDKTGAPYEVFLNPRITQHSNSKTIYHETCATLPNQYPSAVERYNLIFVEYLTLNGKKIVEMIENETAALVQHAITHLGGGVLPISQDPYAFTGKEIDSIMSKADTVAMRILLTTNYEDSLILRKQSIDVRPDSNDLVLRTLIKRMKKALDQTSGVGIAAPQIGINRNVIWVKRMDRPGQPFEVYLNPKIVMTSQNTILFNGDGCLSIPGVTGRTRRYSAIGIEYYLLDGTRKTEVVQGTTMTNFTSVIFQHEIDHLNGILFVDRIE